MFVVKIGGSILFDEENQINDKLISKYAKTIRNVINDTKKKCTIIVGGGKLARKYIAIARKYGASEETSDIIGIESAKLNARLLISALGESAYPTPPNNLEEFQEFFKQTKKVIVCGVCTDICVCHTVCDARDRNYRVEVPVDCVASFDDTAHNFALGHMENVLGAKLTSVGGD